MYQGSTTGEPKVVLVTGSSSGIGASTAELFAQRGYKVAVTGTNRDRVQFVARRCGELSERRYEALAIVADMEEPENGELVVDETIQHFGRLDVLVNNVGIYHKTNATDRSTFELYKKMMRVNVESVIKTSMRAVPHLRKTFGNIVFVSSIASVKPAPDCYAYRASKAAMSSFAKCLAIDVSPMIRVNIVSPGPVSTPLFSKVGMSDETMRATLNSTTLLQRVGETEEIAKTIFYMASEDASFINGAELFVDGGSLCKPPITR